MTVHSRSILTRPNAGVVLNALNIRLDPETIAFILRPGEAKVLLTDTEFSPAVREALARLDTKPVVIDIADAQGPGGARLGELDYEDLLNTGDPKFTELTNRSLLHLSHPMPRRSHLRKR
jgi:fatty-acyl-CoA synthase